MAQQDQPETGGTGLGHRSVSLTRLEHGIFLTAMAGCSAIDVDFITSSIAEPVRFDVTSEGEKMRDGVENHLGDIEITFTVRFPEGAEGDRARERLPKAIAQSRDRLCTVSRTVQRGADVHMREG